MGGLNSSCGQIICLLVDRFKNNSNLDFNTFEGISHCVDTKSPVDYQQAQYRISNKSIPGPTPTPQNALNRSLGDDQSGRGSLGPSQDLGKFQLTSGSFSVLWAYDTFDFIMVFSVDR